MSDGPADTSDATQAVQVNKKFTEELARTYITSAHVYTASCRYYKLIFT